MEPSPEDQKLFDIVDSFPSCEDWEQLYNIRGSKIKSKHPWHNENEDMECVVCLEYTNKRSHFANNGFYCFICRDGVVCRECTIKMASTRKVGESFNTLCCPACKQTSYIYSCLSCKAPTHPGRGLLIKEFTGLDYRIIKNIMNAETRMYFVSEGEKIMRILGIQIRLRASFKQSHEPCMPHLIAIRNAITEVFHGVEADTSTILEKNKKIIVSELEALFPLLCWTHVVGCVCPESVSKPCSSTFTKCDGCGFLIRKTSLHIRPSDSGHKCSHCLKEYGSLKRKSDIDPKDGGGSSKRNRT